VRTPGDVEDRTFVAADQRNVGVNAADLRKRQNKEGSAAA
jgi:hypothetical protein